LFAYAVQKWFSREMATRFSNLNALISRLLRNFPLTGAIVVGWLTFLVWCALELKLPQFQGDGGILLFALAYPFMFLGMLLTSLAGTAVDESKMPLSLFMLICVVVNVAFTWAVLKAIQLAVRQLRENLKKG